MNTFSRSWRLVKASLSVIRADKEMLLFPLISGAALFVVGLLFLLPLLAAGVGDAIMRERGLTEGQSILTAVLTFLMYLVNYTIIIYFNTGLVGAAMIRLRGGDPTFQDGVKLANSRMPQILGYAAIAATVGFILNALSNSARDSNNMATRIGGSIVTSLLGLAWSVLTFLVVPVLVVEGLGPVEAIKRSGALLRKTWGEQIVGNFGIGLIFGLLMLGAMIVIGLPLILIGASANSPVLLIAGIVAAIVVMAVIGMISSAVNSIYAAAVYRYAAEGDVGSFFDAEMVKDAFKPKGKAKPGYSI
ncbi:MAG: hypothetical protein IT323_18020 [Anaerolineae bacterium]|nr:hypothetical protein [Anaerolineae bacterium]